MKYLKNIKILWVALASCILMPSCTDWLDIKPYDQILEDDVYSSEVNMNSALNGLYLNMADAGLYGMNLTFFTVELIGQRYNFSANAVLSVNHVLTALPYFDYSDKSDISHLDGIFRKGYNVIRDVNYYITKVEKTEGVVSPAKKQILLGEAHALRAFLHLDMLRFYGPPPTLEPEGMSVPYYTTAGRDWEPLEPNNVILDKILADIETALTMLQDDAVITEGVVMDGADDFFTGYRNRRINYFAVQALKVRTLMYKGTTESIQAAGTLAKSMIENPAFGEAFPWTTYAEAYALTNPDRVFSKEVIFGIHVPALYERWAQWFTVSKSDRYSILPTARTGLNYMFNATPYTQTTDWRASDWREWSDENYVLSSKYMRPSSSPEFLYFQPLIRKSEIYLAAAEAFQDPQYVDAIRLNRGLKLLSEELGTYNLQEQIRKEYLKEFMGEGQIFYYYKRRGETSILGRAGAVITVSEPKSNYAPPIPQKERER